MYIYLGMTETNAQGASLTGKAFGARPGSAGLPHPIVDIRICDEGGEEASAGETGEIWVRSVCNIREYWHRPEANATDFRDGWLKTGDIGYLDADGYLYLADRAKDMIIRGGENIYCAEVESVIFEIEDVWDDGALKTPAARQFALGRRVDHHVLQRCIAGQRDLVCIRTARARRVVDIDNRVWREWTRSGPVRAVHRGFKVVAVEIVSDLTYSPGSD